MSKSTKKNPKPQGKFDIPRQYKTPYWPDKCPKCQAKMEFAYAPLSRLCGFCGFRITDAEVLRQK